ncbi:MAG: integral membrane protein S linking to the trans Golgi network-domain-containing protein [Monoraphidium minutum]|nr:MAG: integral membrane protein S linking to the trans Golgi network-domain-containing protein [Monoraphidium minutum]
MLYGANVWDPVLIVAQIISVQCLFYIVLGALQFVIIGPRFGHLTIAYIFNYQTMHLGTHIGRLVAVTHAANAVVAATHLMWIVERAKKCLDFASTCYIWHLVFCACYGGFPTSLTWWGVNVGAFIVMSLGGEWLCVRRELQDIPLTSRLGTAARKASGMPVPLPTDDPDALPPRPRGRAAAAATQRPAAAAAAAGAAAAAAAGGVGGVGAVQLSVLGGGGGGGAGGAGAGGGAGGAAGGGGARGESGGGAGPRSSASASARQPKVAALSRTGSSTNVGAQGAARDDLV